MTETLVDRRRRLMRDELRGIALELFLEHGFDEVTVDDIAAAAGASQRTFFRYFATKDEIVLDLARRLDQRLLDALDSRPPEEGPLAALRQAYRLTSHVEAGDRTRVVQLARILSATPALRARAHGEHVGLVDEITERLASRSGLRPSDRSMRVLAAAASVTAAIEFYRWADEGGEGSPSEAIDAALLLLAAGFGQLDTPRGAQ